MPQNPVWKLGEESLWPGMAYIFFPGNVDDANALKEMVEKFRKFRPVSR